jgi:hypothetical protein
MKTEKPVDKMNRLFDKYKDQLEGMFHNMLWKLLMEEIRFGKMSALTTNYTGNGLVIGIADYGSTGYTPTGVYFKKDIPYDESEKIIEDLNTEIFGLSHKTAAEIVLNTMRK